MLCLVRYLFVISTSVIDCLGRFVPEMTYYVSSRTANLTKLKLNYSYNTLYYRASSLSLSIPTFGKILLRRFTNSKSTRQVDNLVPGSAVRRVPSMNS